ncbi:translocation/assembly module TamB domain-containing protein [Crenobacter sp. SG2305]|uniref:translocation/assembly module TamB domain-containing protein n=1 Tax=Crenobacter oryzisoli TaxID=3056844 RepID=UPI0025AB5757|nr:translocation/assembly module TamB domain-containing protein [Crenobacter sp. SG2305]MDN0083853.1 translocation/assembly module TamB domain-containing protein [Crenobacter sp. SG2305]
MTDIHDPQDAGPNPAPPPETPPPQRPSRRFLGYWLAAAGLLTVLTLAGLLGWCAGSDRGFAWLLDNAGRFSQGAFRVKQSRGNLWDGFMLSGVRVVTTGSDVDLDRVRFDWAPRELFEGTLHVRALELGHLRLTSKPTAPTPPPTLPASLALPLSVRVDKLSLDSLTLLPGEPVLYGVDASYRYDAGRHRLTLVRLTTPWGGADGQLSLTDSRPFRLGGQIGAAGRLDEVDVSAKSRLSGDLTDMHLSAEVRGEGVVVELDGRIDPFAQELLKKLKRVNLRAGGINPRALNPAWPKARLNLAVIVEPSSANVLKGGLSLINQKPGSLPAGFLPLRLMTGALHLADGRLTLDTLNADVAGGSVQLTGSASQQQLALRATLAKLDMTQFHAALPKPPLSGVLSVGGSGRAPQLAVDLASGALTVKGQLALARDGAGQSRLDIARLQLAAKNGGELQLAGRLGLGGKLPIDAHAALRSANPSRFMAGWPDGKLSATLTAKGELGAGPKLAAELKLAPSTLSGAPLSGQAKLNLDGRRLSQLSASLRLADNKLDANGAWGKPGDKLRLAIDAPNLGLIGPGFAGRIAGRAELSGSTRQPVVSADLAAQRLRLPGGIAAERVQLTGNLRDAADSPFKVALDVAALRAGGLAVPTLRFLADGTRSRHTLTLDGRAEFDKHAYGVGLSAAGGLDAKMLNWRGTLSRLELNGQPGLRLLAPVMLAASAERVTVGGARLSLLGGNLTLNALDWRRGGTLATSGRADNIALAALSSFVTLPVQQDLVLGADWDVVLGKNPRGQITVTRQRGDVLLPSDSRKLAAGLSTLKASVTLGGGGTQFALDVVSKYATLSGQGALASGAALPTPRTPLSGTLRAEVPSLAAFSTLMPPSISVAGKLSANVALDGALAQPQLRGRLTGEQLAFFDRATGIRLSDGQLAAQLDGQRVVLERLRFAGGKGEVVASGVMDARDTGPNAQAKVVFNKFGVFDKPGRVLVVSGTSELGLSQTKGVVLTGKLRVDRGRIDLPKAGAPTLSDDVVVVGRKPPEPSSLGKLPITVNLELDLGDRFRFVGQGLDVTLSGLIRVDAKPGYPPTANGQVHVEKGRYKAYGQDLDIESGVISFAGPIDNPGLKVRAVRRLSPVNAGVEVTGSVSNPHINLVADEAMSERDKLSWLVLGRASSGDAKDNAALGAAAGALLAGAVNEHIGLFDDLGMTSRKARTAADGSISPAEQVVTVGKQLTRELYLGYEYGITSADQTVKMVYQLTKGWSMVLRAGQQSSSAESRYTLRFD